MVAIIGGRMSHYLNMIEVDKNNPYDYKRINTFNFVHYCTQVLHIKGRFPLSESFPSLVTDADI